MLFNNCLETLRKKIDSVGPLFADDLQTIHCSRRTCITRLAGMGFPPHEIMIISGHKSIKTYEIYIKLNKRNVLKEMIEKVNKKSLEFNK